MLKSLIVASLFILLSLSSFAQSGTTVPIKKIYRVVEQMPEFPGGNTALIKFFAKEVKYPATEASSGMSGTVFVGFIIETDGSVCDPMVMRGIGPAFDAEALRVIQYLPNWQPGKQNGIPVAVKAILPVKFAAPPNKP